jgi:hypothetical protein
MSRPARSVTLVAPIVIGLSVGAFGAPSAVAQQVTQPSAEQQAAQLDRDGATARARVIWQALIDSAGDPGAKARAQRSMAMSYAFDGDCAGTGKYEAMVVAYWQSREQTDPHTAFYQEGEIADEAARVCLDASDLSAADAWYRKGYDRGTSEPAPVVHSRTLWDYRLAHALGRIAARRGDAVEAHREIVAARRILDGDSALAAAQERFFPYLVGYVALYTHDLATADSQLTKAIAWRDNERDPFLHCLLGMTYELEGRQSDANRMYRAAYDLATGHNPPAAFVRPFVRKKLALAGGGA